MKSPKKSSKRPNASSHQPNIIPLHYDAKQHSISSKHISHNAIKVLKRLNRYGFEAYLVGGAIRDILLDLQPKDFDIATNATPEEIKHLFRNCRLIGRRFRLAHIYFGGEIIEVATFRSHHSNACETKAFSNHDGMILRDNVYGEIEDDAFRRDFSINALYYDIDNQKLIDYVGGFNDIKNRQLNIIGDPETRFSEDPVRILRAIRFAAKLSLNISKETADIFLAQKDSLSQVPAARLFEEVRKLFNAGYAYSSYEQLVKYDLFSELFPLTHGCMQSSPSQEYTRQLIEQMLKNTDDRVAKNKPITPAFFFAVMLWPPLKERIEESGRKGVKPLQALHIHSEELLNQQIKHIAIPRRFSIQMREIWALQYRLPKRMGSKSLQLLEHPRFRAAYDLLLLRTKAGEMTHRLADWWTEFQQRDLPGRKEMIKNVQGRIKRQRTPKS